MFRMLGYYACRKAKREQEITLTPRQLAGEVLEESRTHCVFLQHGLVCSHTSLALLLPQREVS